jgi:TolB-like protein
LIASSPKPAREPAPQADLEVRAALQKILLSRQFSKAHRCTALLSYLMDRMLSRGPATPPPEHEIGVAVFGRDRMSYYTGDDPIVRVQAGRLRQRLATYYVNEGGADALRITIPLGSYQPRIERVAVVPLQPAAVRATSPVLMFRPLTCLSPEMPAQSFTLGLNDELGFRLYRELSAYRLAAAEIPPLGMIHAAGTHVLEGTVRQDTARVRVSLHLRHATEETVVWYEQFDSAGDGSITAQEQMAERCVQALQRNLPA